MSVDAFPLSKLTELDPSLTRPVLAKDPEVDLPGSSRLLGEHNKRQREIGGMLAIDQTAGDGGTLTDGDGKPYPLSDIFFARKEEILRNGEGGLQTVPGTATGFSDTYNGKHPIATEAICRTLGVEPDAVSSFSSMSGRTAIFNIQLMQALEGGGGVQSHVSGPWAWPGYLNQFRWIPGNQEWVYAPADPETAFGVTADTIGETIDRIRYRDHSLSSIVLIVPDNPTGTKSMKAEDLIQILTMADKEDARVFLDLFYYYLTDGGMDEVLDWTRFMSQVPKDVLKRLTVLVGTTKGFGSDERYVDTISFDPKDPIIDKVNKGPRGGIGIYPTRSAVLTAAAAFSVDGGPKAAMGVRHTALRERSAKLISIFGKHGFSSVGDTGTYYVTVPLIDSSGTPFILDKNGEPSVHPKDTMSVLRQCGIGVASPDIMRTWEKGSISGVTPRFTSAVPDSDIDKLDAGLDMLKSGTVRSTEEHSSR